MSKIHHILSGINTQPLLWALQANENLWNQHTGRTQDPQSPHHEVDDIWVRYAPPADAAKPGPHEAAWYPCEAILPAVKEIVFPLLTVLRGERLGGVLLTRIRAGRQCKPHRDKGWHAGYYRKFAVQVQSAPGQRFHVEEQALEPRPGDLYEFRNEFEHWVTNETQHDRITLIVCMRTDIDFGE